MVFALYGTVCTLLAMLAVLRIDQSIRIAIAALSAVAIAFVSGTRWNTGTDWLPYYELFVVEGGLSSFLAYPHFEVGYKLLNWLLSAAGASYTLWLFLLTCAVLGIKLYVVMERPYLLLVFVIVFGLSLGDLFPVRQSLAISLGILAVYFYSKGRFFSFGALVGIAALIHKTALLLLFVPVIVRFSPAGAVALAVLFGIIVNFAFFRIVGLVAEIIGSDYVLHQIDVYVNEFSGRVSLPSLTYKTVLLAATLYLHRRYKTCLTVFELNSVKVAAFGWVASSLMELSNVVLNRVSIYFVAFEVIAVPSLFYFFTQRLVAEDKKAEVPIWVVLFSVFYSLRFLSAIMVYWDLYVPFETVFHESHKSVY